MIYDIRTFRRAMIEALLPLRNEARWAAMNRMEIAASIGRIEDAVLGEHAMPNADLLYLAGLTCEWQEWRDGPRPWVVH